MELQLRVARVQDPYAAVVELKLEPPVGRGVVAIAFVDALFLRILYIGETAFGFHVCFKRTDRGEALDKNQRVAKE